MGVGVIRLIRVSRSACSSFATLLLVCLSSSIFPALLYADALRIRLAQDISLGSWSGTGEKEGTSDVCIYRLNGTSYAVTATASGGAFELTSGANTIEFGVSFKGSSGTGGVYTSLPYNTTRNFSGADDTSETCGGGYNANVKVTVTEAELSQAPTGSYTGTLIITLTAS